MRRRGPALRNLDVFHDRVGFTTVWSSKSFAIMKIRSGVRIAAADRGSRAGYARPGMRGRGPLTRGPGRAFPVFRRPPRCVPQATGPFPEPACYGKTRPPGRVVAATTSLGPAAGQPSRPPPPARSPPSGPTGPRWAILAVSPRPPGPSEQPRPDPAPAAIRNRAYLVPKRANELYRSNDLNFLMRR